MNRNIDLQMNTERIKLEKRIKERRSNRDFRCLARKGQTLTQVGKWVQSGTNLLRRASLGEHAPKTKSLVAGASHNRLPARRHGKVQHAERVASQLGHLHQTRVLPQKDLVLGVAVGADELGRVF